MKEQEFHVEVYNSQGERQEFYICPHAIDLSELPSGSYTICFRQGGDLYLERVVK